MYTYRSNQIKLQRLDARFSSCHSDFMETIQSKAGHGRVADAPPGQWIYRALPRRLWPYAQLARWDRPTGWWLLLWPCWWSTAMAASAYACPGDSLMSLLPSPSFLALFLVGAIAVRGAGCTYNDIIDEGIDAQVERTRSRPLPANQVSHRQAWVFFVLQALVGLFVLLQFNSFAVLLGISSVAIIAIYPFMKRITNWPQFVLGLAFSWGALMGWVAEFCDIDGPTVLLYFGSIMWVIGYDTIYAHQDKEYDALVGVKSTARFFGENTKSWLVGLYAGALMLFAMAFVTAHVPRPALAGLVAAGAHMIRQIATFDIDDPDQCLKLFKSNSQIGWIIFIGLICGGAWVALKPLI